MKTIIDSLFLELGIDTAKFSADQAKALTKIQQFESQTKRSAGKAADSIKTVGQAFRDISKDSSVGATANHLDTFAKKLRSLGQAAQVSGGVGTPFGLMAEGLGKMLSPAALGVAAVTLLGKGMWDLNKNTSAANASIYRQSQLSGMNASNLWAWGEAAKTVGANPQDVTGGISSIQTAIAGMMIGAGNAAPQITALARLGLGWNAESGLSDDQVTKMFTKVNRLAAAKGFKNLGGLRALTGPIMNDAMFAIATNPNFNPATLQSQIKGIEPKNLADILQKSLSSQTVLGKLGIQKDILAETAYGGEQGFMAASVDLLTRLLDAVTNIADFLTSGTVFDRAGEAASRGMDWAKSFFGRSSATTTAGMSHAMKALMGGGMSESDAAAMVGNMMQESAMDPLARNASGHVGLMQWDKKRQAAFAKRFGYPMGTGGVPADKQFNDELTFAQDELRSTEQQAASAMAKALSLIGKTSAFMNLDERAGDNSLSRRVGYAQQALMAGRSPVQHTVTSETNIGDIHVHTPSTDPSAHAEAVRKGLEDHPFTPAAWGTLSLGTRGMTG